MDLKQLEYFVRVAELGSFTRASIALDVAQPALSRQVRLLEVELRQSLLVRNGRGATPTEAGKLLLEHGRGILHQVERAREELGRVRGSPGRPRRHRPAAHPGAGADRAADRAPFARNLPDAQLSISEGLSAMMQEWLVNGRLDIAVLYNAAARRRTSTITPLLDEDLLLVRARPPGLTEDPPPAPIALREVAQLPLVIPSRPNAIRMHVEVRNGGHRLPALDCPGDRWRLGHSRPGGRWRGLRAAARQRRDQLDQAVGVHHAHDLRSAAAHAAVGGHQLVAARDPDAAIHPGADPAHRQEATFSVLNSLLKT